MKLLFKQCFTVLFFACGILLATSCTKDVYQETDPDPTPSPAPGDSTVFDFATEQFQTLAFNYNVPQGYKVFFEVYTQNPLSTDANGVTVKKDMNPLMVGYTDENGAYRQRVKIPAVVNTLYIYTANAGVPQLLYATVEGNTLSEVSFPPVSNKTSMTKAVNYSSTTNSTVKFDILTKILGSWETSQGTLVSFPGLETLPYVKEAKILGRPTYMDYVDTRYFAGQPNKKITSDILNTINSALPGDKQGRVNPKYLKNGDINVSKDAEVNLYFVDEQCAYMNTLAYYCYPTANPPKSEADIKVQTIAFPNAKSIKWHSVYMNGYNEYGAIIPGEGIKLRYYDDKGNDKGYTFPKGTSIGWILYSNGFLPIQVYKGLGAIYSNAKLNEKELPHVAVFKNNDFVITSFEDSKKTVEDTDVNYSDYKDLVFHVSSTPSDAITPDIPDVNPDPEFPSIKPQATSSGTLSFEDLWPAQGDFDMNDVVVEYKSKLSFNTNNQLDKVVVDFNLRWTGASIHNNFAFQLPVSKNDVEISFLDGEDIGQAYIDNKLNLATVRLFNDALLLTKNNTKNSKITVSINFKKPISTDSKEYEMALPPFNPFITTSSMSKEVHLTGYPPTEVADKSLFGQLDDNSLVTNIWYTTFIGTDQMPFAINMANDPGNPIEFQIPAENKKINVYYPKFGTWISSKGMQDADWFMNPIDKK